MRLPETFDEFQTFHGPARCSHKDCIAPARFGLAVKIWAKGFPKTSTPLDCLFSVKVCENHRYEVDAGFWTPEGERMIRDAIRAVGRAEPDFDSAEFSWVPL